MVDGKRTARVGAGLALVAICTACSTAAPRSRGVWQNLPFTALVSGYYDGTTPIGAAKLQGDVGLGAFDALDGEVVVLDGHLYRFRSQGGVDEPPDSARLAFAMMAPLVADGDPVPVPAGSDFAGLGAFLDTRIPTKNTFYALRIDGTFAAVLARTFPRQEKPYPPLCSVVPTAPSSCLTAVEGTLIGFRSPEYIGDLNIPKYHFHFISRDRQSGGHVLEMRVAQASARIARLDGYTLDFPSGEAFARLPITTPAPSCPPPKPPCPPPTTP